MRTSIENAGLLATALLLLGAIEAAAGIARIVGTGTPESCTEVALDAALAAGGSIGFDCGGPAEILISRAKIITTATSIDGDGLVSIQSAAGSVSQAHS